MTETEKEVLKQAKERKAVYVKKKYLCDYDNYMIGYWILFIDWKFCVVDVIFVTVSNFENYELFNSLEDKNIYFFKELMLGLHQEQLDI